MLEGHAALLGSADVPPFEQRPGRGANYFVVCDHASAAIPASLGSLGMSPEQLGTHIAIDLGARWVALGVAERLGAPAFLAGYSRLVIDCNRHPSDPASIATESDRQIVPGNLELTAAARAARIEALFLPYHRAIGAALDGLAAQGARPLFLSIHSCTPRLDGQFRPWHIGLSHLPDDPLASSAIEALRRDPRITVGDNQPYPLEVDIDYTTPQHAMRRGLPYLQVEFRQDLISTEAGAGIWADRFVDALTSLPG
jgi:predicted N-formylglutamate amidohydrolase